MSGAQVVAEKTGSRAYEVLHMFIHTRAAVFIIIIFVSPPFEGGPGGVVWFLPPRKSGDHHLQVLAILVNGGPLISTYSVAGL